MLTKSDFFIHYCSRLELNAEFKGKICQLLSCGLNWDYILEKASEEGVCALIYKALLEIKDIEMNIPENFFVELKDKYYYQTARNTLIYKELEDVLRAAEKIEVQLMPFKGIVFADLVYNDIGTRSMADIDILVKKTDLIKLDSLLKGLGYQASIGSSDFLEEPFNAQRNSLLYSSQRIGAVNFHVYWHIVNFLLYKKEIVYQINMDKIWLDSSVVSLGQSNARGFSTNHNIIYLCLHAMQHSYKPLLLLCDINELVRVEKDKIDWDNLAREAISFGLNKYVYYGLYLASEILEAPVPQKALCALRPKKISIFEKKFISSVLSREAVFAGGELIYFGMNDSLIDRVKFIFNLLFPLRKEMAAIKQKKISDVNICDYAARFFSGIRYGFKALGKLLK